MGQTARDQKRTDVMLQVVKETVAPAQGDGILDRVPGRYREVLGELRVLVAMSDLCRLTAIKRIQDLKAWCLDHRVSWEEVCDAALPKCRRTIDRYLDTLETFGDGSYEAIMEMTSHAERVQARRLLKDGTIRHEDGAIVISGKRFQNDPAHAYQIVEVLREAFAQAEAAKDELAKEKELRQRQGEASERREAKLHELLDAQGQKIAHLDARPTPKELQTALDRKWWPILQEIRTAWIVRQGQLAAMIDEDEHSRAFWCGVHALLAEVQEGVYTLAMQLLGSRGNDYEPIVNLERGAPIQLGTNPDWPIPETPPEAIQRLRGGNGHDTTHDSLTA